MELGRHGLENVPSTGEGLLPATIPPDYRSMWRALFLAIGIFLCVLGAQCLVVDRFVMASDQPLPTAETPATLFGAPPSTGAFVSRDIEPADWAPWSFLSAGAVVILYALTINKP